MPRTLVNDTSSVSMTNLEYTELMRMIYRAGWRPEGTVAPEGWRPKRRKDGTVRKWPRMNYFSRMGQSVTESDAQAMADVAESVLPDIPDFDALGHKIYQTIDMPDRAPIRFPRPGSKYNSFEFFSGESRKIVERFVHLTRTGSFQIQ